MKIKVLREDVEHHVKEEESEMFPDAKKFLGEKHLMELGAELEARKEELAKDPPSKGTTSRSTRGPERKITLK
jgi:hemerythrin-like domain-containing protein